MQYFNLCTLQYAASDLMIFLKAFDTIEEYM